MDRPESLVCPGFYEPARTRLLRTRDALFWLAGAPLKGSPFDAVFLLLKQKKGLQPRRLGWAELLQKHFRIDPLRDRAGQHTNWVGRLKATV
jgi:hypothetical protein